MLRRSAAVAIAVLILAGGPAGHRQADAQTPPEAPLPAASAAESPADPAATLSGEAVSGEAPQDLPPESGEVDAPGAEQEKSGETDDFADKLTKGRMGRAIRRFTYLAIIGVLLLCGMGVPLPEELPIITSGVLAKMGHLSPWPALLSVIFGILAGDSIMFFLGRKWGRHVLEHRFARILLTHERQAKIADYFHKYGAWIIFAARFLPGLRSPLYLTAGSMKVRWLTFLAMDGLAALLSIPLSFWLAYYFTEQLREVLDVSHLALYWFLGILAVGLIVGHVIWDRWRARVRAAADVVDPEHPDPVLDLIEEASHHPGKSPGGPAVGASDASR